MRSSFGNQLVGGGRESRLSLTVDDLRERVRNFLATHQSQRWVAEKIGCTETHLRRFLNQGKPLSNTLLDNIRELLDREEKRTSPLTDDEIEAIRSILPYIGEIRDAVQAMRDRAGSAGHQDSRLRIAAKKAPPTAD